MAPSEKDSAEFDDKTIEDAETATNWEQPPGCGIQSLRTDVNN